MNLLEYLAEANRAGLKNLSLSLTATETPRDMPKGPEIGYEAKLYPLNQDGSGRTAEFKLKESDIEALSASLGLLKISKWDKGKGARTA